MHEDNAYLEALYYQYADKLERRCYAWAHGKSHYDDVIKSAIQQTFLDVHKELSNLPPQSHMDYWITEVCRRNFQDALRKKLRFADRHTLIPNDEMALLNTETADFLKQICTEESLEEIIDLLSNPLTPRERQFMRDHYRHEMSLQEIALAWGASMDAVKSLHKRIRKKIRKQNGDLLLKINMLRVTLFLFSMHLYR